MQIDAGLMKDAKKTFEINAMMQAAANRANKALVSAGMDP